MLSFIRNNNKNFSLSLSCHGLNLCRHFYCSMEAMCSIHENIRFFLFLENPTKNYRAFIFNLCAQHTHTHVAFVSVDCDRQKIKIIMHLTSVTPFVNLGILLLLILSAFLFYFFFLFGAERRFSSFFFSSSSSI